jgi:transcriptional regulator with XRE-family HTH domain
MLFIVLILSLCDFIVNFKYLSDNAISFRLFYIPNRGGKMIAERIKFLREQNKLTQSELSKKLGITRASVNAWEMGISVPSTQYIVELAQLFCVSTDYLLGVDSNAPLNTDGLTEDDIHMIYELINYLRKKNF